MNYFNSLTTSQKKKIKLTLKIIAVVFVLLLSLFFVFRNSLLQEAIAKVTIKLDKEYNSTFSVKEASFDGFTGITMTELVLVPKNADTIFHIQKLKTSVSFWNLLIGNVQLGTLEVKNGYVQLIKNEKGKNFQAFLKNKTDKVETVSDTKKDYAKITYALISKVLNLVPTDMLLENLIFRVDDSGKKVTLVFQHLRLANKQLESAIHIQTNTFGQQWRIKGYADPRNKKADIRFVNVDTGAIKLPYFDERYNLKTSFDSIRVAIEDIDKDGDELHIDGFASITNLNVNHPKIASKDVFLKNARFDYRFLLGSHFVSIDSSSTIQINKIKIKPFIKYETEVDPIYSFKVVIPKMKANDFITSLPDGLFKHFQGMEATGNFDYALDFKFNKNKPNTLVFDSKINKENFKITKYGETNLSKINGDFTYRAIDGGVEQRPVYVGLSNPYFTPLNQISPYLQKCVLTSEDPSFFHHQGFINEAFKQSILKNIRTKKFARGASTISMQLVKNVFLTREKTLSRKLEEILLVYILENNRIASKARMLEVYFNIIEWGPNVYGIGEAAAFYFQKTPANLTLKECLFLAMIVPKPKKFTWQFDNQGKLRAAVLKKEIYLTNLMLRRGVLTADDTIGQKTPLYISGRAHSFLNIKVQDTVAVDSLIINNEFEF